MTTNGRRCRSRTCPAASSSIGLGCEQGCTRLRVVADREWKFALGPYVFSDLLHGERYDARLEQQGWDCAGFDDSAWVQPGIGNGGQGAIEAARAPPTRVTRTLTAKKVHRAP